MRVLVSADDLRTHGDVLAALDDRVTWVVLEDVAAGSCPDAEVAWLSTAFWLGPARAQLIDVVLADDALQWVYSSAAGVDTSPVPELLGRGVQVEKSSVNAVPIAEFVVRAVLDAYQRPERWRAAQSEGRWERHPFREVLGTTWLVVGLGGIGSAVCERVRPFGVTIIGVRRDAARGHPGVDRLVPVAELGSVLPEADVVVIAAPRTPDTEGLVDAGFLAQMRPGSILVNVSRGALVDEEALVRALERGIPALAVLDVVQVEPLPASSALWRHPRVVLTPHNAADGQGRHRRAAHQVVSWLLGLPSLNS